MHFNISEENWQVPVLVKRGPGKQKTGSGEAGTFRKGTWRREILAPAAAVRAVGRALLKICKRFIEFGTIDKIDCK